MSSNPVAPLSRESASGPSAPSMQTRLQNVRKALMGMLPRRVPERFRSGSSAGFGTRWWPGHPSFSSAKCKSGTTVLLVHHPAPWSPWSPWSTLIHLGPQFPECGYTKWSKQDQGGPGVVQGHRQDHGAGWWTRSIQDHRGPLKNFLLM